MEMELVYQAFLNCKFGEEEEVIKNLLNEKTLNAVEALIFLQDIINGASNLEEKMVEIVSAAWAYIKTHQLWIGVYDGLHDLEVVLNFKEKIKPFLSTKTRRYDNQRLKIRKAIMSRWKVATMAEALPLDIQPPIMGRDFLCTLNKLADRVLDHKTALQLIQKQLASRVENSRPKVKHLKTSDIEAIISTFYMVEKVASPAHNEENEVECEKNKGPSSSTQQDYPKIISLCNSCHHDCNKILGKIPAKGKMPQIEGMKILKWAIEIGFKKFCHRHLRALAGNCIGLKNSQGINAKKLIGRLNMVTNNDRHIKNLFKRYPTWFVAAVVPRGDVHKQLGLYMWQPEKPIAYTSFGFDAANVFNRFARNKNAWDKFQFDGTINIDGFFDYLVRDGKVFHLIEQEFDMYKHHLRTFEQNGNESRGWMRHMIYSLTQQVVRQDPAYWAIMAAARPDKNWRLISYPYYTKDTTKGDHTGFKHFDINVDEYVKTGQGKNIIQSSLSLDNEYDDGCTILVKGFHKVIHKWWDEVNRRNQAKSGNTTNASQTYMENDKAVFGKLVPVPCKRGAIRITKPEILHGSTPIASRRRRTVFVWHCGIREDHKILDLERAETWEELVLCHSAFIAPKKSTSGEGFRYGRPTFTFPGVHKLGSTSYIGDAIVGARRWDDSAVMEERNILVGENLEAAWKLVEEIRARLIVEFTKAFEVVRHNEMASYKLERSFFLGLTNNNKKTADNDVCDSEMSDLSMVDENAFGDDCE